MCPGVGLVPQSREEEAGLQGGEGRRLEGGAYTPEVWVVVSATQLVTVRSSFLRDRQRLTEMRSLQHIRQSTLLSEDLVCPTFCASARETWHAFLCGYRGRQKK